MQTAVASFDEALKLSQESKEGLVFLGAGGDPADWIKGVSEMLKERDIAPSSNPEDLFESTHMMTSTGGRKDLLMLFKKDNKIDIGKLAIWRIQFGGVSWLSDFVVNYAGHYASA